MHNSCLTLLWHFVSSLFFSVCHYERGSHISFGDVLESLQKVNLRAVKIHLKVVKKSSPVIYRWGWHKREISPKTEVNGTIKWELKAKTLSLFLTRFTICIIKNFNANAILRPALCMQNPLRFNLCHFIHFNKLKFSTIKPSLPRFVHFWSNAFSSWWNFIAFLCPRRRCMNYNKKYKFTARWKFCRYLLNIEGFLRIPMWNARSSCCKGWKHQLNDI